MFSSTKDRSTKKKKNSESSTSIAKHYVSENKKSGKGKIISFMVHVKRNKKKKKNSTENQLVLKRYRSRIVPSSSRFDDLFIRF